MSEVVGMFTDRRQATDAIDRLVDLGYDSEQIGVIERGRDEHGDIVAEAGDDTMGETEKGVTGGAVGGLTVGAGASLLASAGMLAIPGIGPFLAAGSVAATLSAAAVGAAGGAAIGGAAGAIFGDDTDDETSRHYRDGVGAGSTLVLVHAEPARADETAAVLRDAGAARVNLHGGDGWID